MFDLKKWMAFLVVGFVLLCVWPLQGQEPEEEEADHPDIQVSHVFPGEQINAPSKNVDAREIVLEAIQKLGGEPSYKAIKDLQYTFTQKCYQDGKYIFIETAKCYNLFSDRMKTRMDFDYIDKTNRNRKLDYREVMGKDGAFKYLDGRILRGLKDVKEAADRLSLNNLYFFTPFHVDLEVAEPVLTGISTWTEDDDGKEVKRECYKVLLLVPEKYSRVRKKMVSLLVDVQTKELVRIVYQTRESDPKRDRLKIIDIKERTDIAGIRFPTYLTTVEYTHIGDITEVTTRKIHFTDIVANHGLEGIGFEVVEQ